MFCLVGFGVVDMLSIILLGRWFLLDSVFRLNVVMWLLCVMMFWVLVIVLRWLSSIMFLLVCGSSVCFICSEWFSV